MFKRVTFEEWQAVITIVAFVICFTTFLFFCWRAVRMSRRESNRLSHLPLDNEPSSSSDER
jgi:cbb3-type cytochrome oxidase subunit 3